MSFLSASVPGLNHQQPPPGEGNLRLLLLNLVADGAAVHVGQIKVLQGVGEALEGDPLHVPAKGQEGHVFAKLPAAADNRFPRQQPDTVVLIHNPGGDPRILQDGQALNVGEGVVQPGARGPQEDGLAAA